jgi:hypothetical protein
LFFEKWEMFWWNGETKTIRSYQFSLSGLASLTFVLRSVFFEKKKREWRKEKEKEKRGPLHLDTFKKSSGAPTPIHLRERRPISCQALLLTLSFSPSVFLSLSVCLLCVSVTNLPLEIHKTLPSSFISFSIHPLFSLSLFFSERKK